LAAQICAGKNREVGVTLTPVGQGRFEIYLNGEQVYDRKQPPADVKDPVGDVRGAVSVGELVRTKLLTALERANAAQPAGSAHD
jgi:predicted Rdx family selenoprotein